MSISYDHFIGRAHMRQWSTGNSVSIWRRDMPKPKRMEIGKLTAAEQSLNDKDVEAAYGKIESSFSRALVRLLDRSATPLSSDWTALREYALLMHDRFPALRGQPRNKFGLEWGNSVMVPNPANWGMDMPAFNLEARVATGMPREALKRARLELLSLNAELLPKGQQIFRGTPMLLGDAGLHAVLLRRPGHPPKDLVAMPLTSESFIVFGEHALDFNEIDHVAQALVFKVAMESSVVIDTVAAPLMSSIVAPLWAGHPNPLGVGVPRAMRIFEQPDQIS